MTDCIFCKIARKEIPSEMVYEDDDVFAFLDIKPVHPGHVIVIAKAHSTDFTDIDPVDLQAVTAVAQRIARAVLALGYDGVTVTTNAKPASGQTVFHTHFHVIPRTLSDGLKHWPQHEYPSGTSAEWRAKIKDALR